MFFICLSRSGPEICFLAYAKKEKQKHISGTFSVMQQTHLWTASSVTQKYKSEPLLALRNEQLWTTVSVMQKHSLDHF